MTGTFPTALEIARAWAKVTAKSSGKKQGIYQSEDGALRIVELPSSFPVIEIIFPS